MNVDFSCTVPDMKFGDFRNGRTTGLGQEPTFASDWYSAAFNGIDDVEEVASYLRAFKLVQGLLRNRSGLPISVRLLGDAHRLLMDGARGSGKQPGELPLAKLYRW